MNKSIVELQAEKIHLLQQRVQELEKMAINDHPQFESYRQSVDYIIDCQQQIINELQPGGKVRRRIH